MSAHRTCFRIARLRHPSCKRPFTLGNGGLEERPIPLRPSPTLSRTRNAGAQPPLTLRRLHKLQYNALRSPRHMVSLLRPVQHTFEQNAAQSSTYPAARTLHSSARRQDVFFVAFPALKSHLLNLTRICLVVLPFVYRYK